MQQVLQARDVEAAENDRRAEGLVSSHAGVDVPLVYSYPYYTIALTACPQGTGVLRRVASSPQTKRT